ncbi:MAG: hypothetical protein MUC96_37005 [Myxococcaceae bacterium]|jgi:hypothetical protein|nr:hypothetical protein [Myxococcaceae bacterium]
MRTTSLLLSLLFTLGCTPGVGPVFVSKVESLVGTCIPPSSMAGAGAPPAALSLVDVAASQPSATMAVTLGGLEVIKSAASNPPLIVGGRTLATAGRENVRIESVSLRYTSRLVGSNSRAGIAGLDRVEDTVTLNRYVDGMANVIVVPLFGAGARRVFEEGLVASNEDVYDMTVTFQVRGTLQPSTQPISTELVPVSFRLVKSAVDCAGEARLGRVASGTPISDVECSYFGINRKFTQAQCCTTLGDPSVPGCEPQ